MKYNIYAIGNAIMDTVIQVEDNILDELQITKGTMTLIDENILKKYQNRFTNITKELSSGGSAANSIIAASYLGSKCYFECKTANDDIGTAYINEFKSNQIDTTDINIENGNSGQCFVFVTKDSQRTMSTFLGISASINEDNVNEEAIKNSHLVYIEGYLITSDNSFKAALKTIELAKKYNKKIAFTLSDPNIIPPFIDRINAILNKSIDILFCNEDESNTFLKCNNQTSIDFLKQSTNLLLITKGKAGASIISDSDQININCPLVEAVDSNGAGDCFAGVFLSLYIQNNEIEKSAELACKAASKCVTQFGARLSKDLLLESISAASNKI